eukprot:INCI9918.5.p1 GENE.INCI9918.5~~INCI9918.5.p1  ORF type:complete len:460 (+),score=43.44 INCI9918.5:147-1526(+)
MPRRRTVLDGRQASGEHSSPADEEPGDPRNDLTERVVSNCCGFVSRTTSSLWHFVIGALLLGTVLVIRTAIDRSLASHSLELRNQFESAATQVPDFIEQSVSARADQSAGLRPQEETKDNEMPQPTATPVLPDEGRGYEYYSPQRQPQLDTVGVSAVFWLASHPYSGSHLVRRLVESATLQPTYSMYNEEGTLAIKFEGLDLPVRTSKDVEKYIQEKIGIRSYDARTECDPLLIKTHLPYSPYALTWQEAFPRWAMHEGIENRIIRLVRNPWDQILRMIFKASSVDGAPSEERVRMAARNYLKFHNYWDQVEKEVNARPQLSANSRGASCQRSTPRHQRRSLVIRYEDLCTDLDSAVLEILEFLGVEGASDMVSSKAAQNAHAAYLQRALRIERPTDPMKHIGKHSFSKAVPEGDVWFTPRIFSIINETCWPVIQRHGYANIVPPQWRVSGSLQNAHLR